MQYLLVMFGEYGCLHSELNSYFLCLLPVVEKINGVIISLRRSLSLSIELLSTESEFALTHRPVAFNRLSNSSRISDFTSISIQFLVDLLLPNISTHVSLPSGRIFLIIQCLGQFPWFCGELLNYGFGPWIKSVFDCLNLYLSYAGVIFNSWPR
ncbi:unnamed protein product [Schistosoma mattheei]|uniref:Uncharacterized protein n=1 Tax=Schistosoma mattheei TaxID=31246 RepID=A0A3P8FRL8_9TREM|nr:unnamed protein product [Schistosoma mattheei]